MLTTRAAGRTLDDGLLELLTSMSRSMFTAAAAIAVVSAFVACGDDDNAVVSKPTEERRTQPLRTRAAAGTTAVRTPDRRAASPFLPTTSAAYETNAKTELDLRAAFTHSSSR